MNTRARRGPPLHFGRGNAGLHPLPTPLLARRSRRPRPGNGPAAAGQTLARLQTLVGAALMAAGLYLFSTLGAVGGSSRNWTLLSGQTYLILAAFGFGGIVATLSVAVQNAAPFRDVGVATAALQFYRSLGGMIGLAATGVVMTKSFRAGMEGALAANVRDRLPQGLLNSMIEDPSAVLDPSTVQDLKEKVAGSDAGAALSHYALRNTMRPTPARKARHMSTHRFGHPIERDEEPRLPLSGLPRRDLGLTGSSVCGFCTNGIRMSRIPFPQGKPHPPQSAMRDLLSGNLCRRAGCRKIVDTVQVGARTTEEDSS